MDELEHEDTAEETAEAALAALCERLEEVLVDRRTPLSMIDAICETGADPRALRTAFERLVVGGRATRVGGDHRGWNLLPKAHA